MLMTNFQAIVDQVKTRAKKTVVVAAADDIDVLEASTKAIKDGLARFIYVGDAQRIRQLAKEQNLDIARIEMIEQADEAEASRTAIDLVKAGKGQVLMKGKVSTSKILGMVLKDEELKQKAQSPLISHVGVFEWQKQLRVFTDAALNIAPDLEQKRQIAVNAIQVAKKLGYTKPRVAFLSAVEKVSPKMQSSVDAEALANMTWEDAIAGGPLAFDGAMFEEAYKIKGIPSPVEGKAEILVCPNIETGNIFYKTLSWMMQVDMAGVVTGAAIPFILTSRSDNERVKFLSIATTIYLAD